MVPDDVASALDARVPAPSPAVQRAERITDLVSDREWASLFTRLTKYAHACLRRRDFALAEDFAQRAIEKVLDVKYKAWDPATEPDIFDHLAKIVKGDVSNRRRDRAAHRELSTMHATLEEIAPASPDGDPESTLEGKQALAKLAARIGEELAGDMLALRIVALSVEGITTPREQAAAVGAPYDEVRNARKRLFRVTAELARELGLRQEGDDDAAA